MVNIPCKNCGQAILVDGTVPPPPGTEPDAELPPAIPKQAPLPVIESSDEQYAQAIVGPAREKTISHVDGPISERGPSARIGRYALFEQFASGGMATVHFGRLDGAGGFSRVVAIKRLLPHLVANREFTDMLLNEARLAARVRHPNVVATLDVVASKGDVLLVLDYVEGEALSTLCRAQAKEKRELVPIPIAVGIMQDVLHGLLAIHEATDEKGRALDLVHRDISPPNVLVGVDGVARVLDFGIAKALQHLDESITGRRMGKMGYMSPEQIRGDSLTQRSDVFSAGIVLWELLCMRRLFQADKPEERMESILRGDYPSPRSLREDVPQELNDAVMKALERSPDARFSTIREFSEALESAPRAARREIGEWVSELAQSALAERTRMVAVLENWSEGPQIPLSSSPFASEIPPPVAAGSWPPPSAVSDPTPISSTPRENSSANATALAKATAPEPPPARSTNGLVWLLLAVIVAMIVGYVANR
ncbi:MAG TPA: serine/threonine-protein kinase [Polyangiaceae bacterium]|nr:serine/threonine-protein kinase [Polyangiaceae bacterium]